MYVVRDIFNTKPGKAKELVAMFKKTMPFLPELGVKNARILTDTVSSYWTVVWETEVENLDDYFDMPNKMGAHNEALEAMKGYMKLVTGGHREIFKIE